MSKFFLKAVHTVESRVLTGLDKPHPGFFRLLMKGIFDAYFQWIFDKKNVFWICDMHYYWRRYGSWGFGGKMSSEKRAAETTCAFLVHSSIECWNGKPLTTYFLQIDLPFSLTKSVFRDRPYNLWSLSLRTENFAKKQLWPPIILRVHCFMVGEDVSLENAVARYNKLRMCLQKWFNPTKHTQFRIL